MCSVTNHRSDGEASRDAALSRLRAFRPVLVRRIQRAFLRHLIDYGPDTSDTVRAVVPIPDGIDPRVVGAAVRALSTDGNLTVAVGREKSRRPQAHARGLDVWAVKDTTAALAWLAAHPELPDPELTIADPADPFAI